MRPRPGVYLAEGTCRRNLVRSALREVEKFFPREQWMTVVVQGDQTARVALLGGEHSRAFEQPVGAASTSTAIPQPTARSAPSAREISRKNRARLHQLSKGFCCMRLLRSAFRAIARARDASGDVSRVADSDSERAKSQKERL